MFFNIICRPKRTYERPPCWMWCVAFCSPRTWWSPPRVTNRTATVSSPYWTSSRERWILRRCTSRCSASVSESWPTLYPGVRPASRWLCRVVHRMCNRPIRSPDWWWPITRESVLSSREPWPSMISWGNATPSWTISGASPCLRRTWPNWTLHGTRSTAWCRNTRRPPRSTIPSGVRASKLPKLVDFLCTSEFFCSKYILKCFLPY